MNVKIGRWNRLAPLVAGILLALGISLSAHAQDVEAAEPADPGETPALSASEQAAYERLVALDASFAYASGTVGIGEGLATLNLPETLRYLDPAGTERLLVEGWGNPDGSGTLGMILPAETSPLSADGWGVIVTYDEEGYVSDEDADSIDYDAMLSEMQASTEEDNEARAEQGYERVELVGWAEHPRYEKETHKLFWAKELAFEGMPGNTLNYNVRVLGRRGVLVLNAVASMEQLPLIQAAMPGVITAADFDPGHRYADYQPGTDKVAAYGLAALVAGGVAAKSGLFAKLFGVLLAAKKIAIPAVVAAFAAGSAWWRRRQNGATPPTAS
jgi:uncharacterized membrane-anchored protein